MTQRLMQLLHAQGRAKKDAKQAAAAAILEELLQYMPNVAFLVPRKSTKPVRGREVLPLQ